MCHASRLCAAALHVACRPPWEARRKDWSDAGRLNGCLNDIYSTGAPKRRSFSVEWMCHLFAGGYANVEAGQRTGQLFSLFGASLSPCQKGSPSTAASG